MLGSKTTSQQDLVRATDEAVGEGHMDIAWRYGNLPAIKTAEVGGGRERRAPERAAGGAAATDPFCGTFDISKSISRNGGNIVADNVNTVHTVDLTAAAAMWPSNASPDGDPETNGGVLTMYAELYNRIEQVIRNHAVAVPASGGPPSGSSGNKVQPVRSVLRIALHSLGSPSWPIADGGSNGAARHSLLRFLQRLRGLVRKSYAVVMIAAPGRLIPESASVTPFSPFRF